MAHEDHLNAALAGRYRVQHEIGSGGMATVYLAEDLRHQRNVAIKVLRPELSSSVGAERFLREIQIAAKITHPHILPLYDSGEADGQLFYVMPFVEGESLRDHLNREHQLPVEEALKITGQVAAALGHAHEQGIVHRDIKPENILVSGGEAVVADFGIAGAVELAGGERLTATGMAIGTPAYMSPEQAGGRPDIDPRSDIYSLGCVLYEMLLGDPPFMGSTAEAILARKLTEPVQKLRPVRETVPPGVEQVALKALARLPVDRFKTAEEFAVELERAPTVVVEEGEEPFSRSRFRRILASFAIGVAAVLFGIWWVSNSNLNSVPPPQLAVLLPATTLEDPEQETVVLKIYEGVIDELTLLGLRMKARQSMMRYRDAGVPLQEIAEVLGVDEFIAFSVSRSTDSALVRAQLVEGETENETWAGFYSGSAGDLSDLITSLAGAVATQVLGDLTADQQARLARVREADPQAYSEYLAGRVLTRSRTPVAVETAIQHFLRAIEIDSTYAPAVAMLSGMYSYQGFYGIKAHTEVFPLARKAAHRALALDSTSAQAHGALAFIHRYDRAWALEGKRWERAILLEPQDHDLHAGYAYWLQHMGRLDEAIEEYRIALEIEPLHMQYKKEMARQLYFARRFNEAIEWHHEALGMGPNDFGARIHLALTLVQVGRMDEAVEEMERAYASATQPRTAAIRAYVFAHAGREEEARAVLAQTEDEAALLGAVPRAWAYGALGEIDRAFPYLDQAFENRSPWLFQLNDAAFVPLRDDPRFDDLLVRLGLPVEEGG